MLHCNKINRISEKQKITLRGYFNFSIQLYHFSDNLLITSLSYCDTLRRILSKYLITFWGQLNSSVQLFHFCHGSIQNINWSISITSLSYRDISRIVTIFYFVILCKWTLYFIWNTFFSTRFSHHSEFFSHFTSLIKSWPYRDIVADALWRPHSPHSCVGTHLSWLCAPAEGCIVASLSVGLLIFPHSKLRRQRKNTNNKCTNKSAGRVCVLPGRPTCSHCDCAASFASFLSPRIPTQNSNSWPWPPLPSTTRFLAAKGYEQKGGTVKGEGALGGCLAKTDG